MTFGLIIGYLWYGGSEATGEQVAANIQSLLRDARALGLRREALARLLSIEQEAEALGHQALPPELAARLRHEIVQLYAHWSPELYTKTAIVARDDGLFSSYKLLTDVLSFFPAGSGERLPDIARFDLVEAGRCIAFGMPTAAAFHLMRAVEAGLRQLYENRTRKPLPSGPRAAMGPLIQSLRVHGKDDPLLDLLSIIVRNFRNPTQHPEATYETLDAEYLFALSAYTITKILEET